MGETADPTDFAAHVPADEQRHMSRTSFVLYASQIEFLDRLSATVRADTGHGLTKRAVIETLVSVLPMARISLGEVVSETHLKEMLRTEKRGSESDDPAAAPLLGRVFHADLADPK